MPLSARRWGRGLSLPQCACAWKSGLFPGEVLRWLKAPANPRQGTVAKTPVPVPGDGSRLFVNWNGGPADQPRNDFGLSRP